MHVKLDKFGKSKKLKKLNFGCGKIILKGFVNVDIQKGKGIDKHFNFNRFPYPFKNNTFDVVFAYSIFQYFPDLQYAKDVISEMTRISRNIVFVGDLPLNSHESNHTLYSKEDFSDWEITYTFYKHYGSSRFNIYKGEWK